MLPPLQLLLLLLPTLVPPLVATKEPRRGAFLVFSSDPMEPDSGRLAFEAVVGVLII